MAKVWRLEPSLSFWLNDAKTASYVQSDAQIVKTRGFIAPQLHSHPQHVEGWLRDFQRASKVRYRGWHPSRQPAMAAISAATLSSRPTASVAERFASTVRAESSTVLRATTATEDKRLVMSSKAAP